MSHFQLYCDTACVRASESMRVSEGASLRVRACERKGKGKREGKWEGKDDQLVRESEKARNRDSDGNDAWGRGSEHETCTAARRSKTS